ncbi:type I-E CRISPR-associated protein Cas6/Cse3/CasE [Streptomyces sp. NPDC001985]|uniref:type I-E CRISPR-associated protein Cas6/Cse3/CasE n=1 Tax=Streptomyces sp. NPDC001985 TaxID=3154406 RepID=UPI00332C64AB
MPYLSKIALNPHRRSAPSLLANPHRMHATLLAGLAVQPVTERVLWRLENNNPHRAELLVLTDSRPSWSHLVEQAGWPGADHSAPLIADYTPLLDRITPGREFAFRLTANPVQSLRHPTKLSPAQAEQRAEQDARTGTAAERRIRGFRVPHRTAGQQLHWLLDRTDRHGFTIPATGEPAPPPALGLGEPGLPAPAVALTARDILRFSKRQNGPRLTLSTATYQGRLRVTDPDLLRHTLLQGIGPAKAYGQGLLTLAPLSREDGHHA